MLESINTAVDAKTESMRKLVKEFSTISFEWIPRGLNEYADELSKRAMIERDVQFKIQPNLEK